LQNERTFQIAVFPGDGIGAEVMDACLGVLNALQERVGGFRLATEILPGGAALFRDTGTALSDENFRKAEAADAILFGAMGLPEVRYPDGTEISPHLVMRREFGLLAGVRPVKRFANRRTPLADPRGAEIDIVILRESTEGLFASHGKGVVENDAVARDTMVITRPTCERLFDFACNLAARRKERTPW
jgi:3-isopropylmalate dehydrogenase